MENWDFFNKPNLKKVTVPVSLRKLVNYNSKTRENSPTQEQVLEMNKRIKSAVELFQGVSGWRIAGGLTVSLLSGEYVRQHKDIEIKFPISQISSLNDQIKKKEYSVGYRESENKQEKTETIVLCELDTNFVSSEHDGKFILPSKDFDKENDVVFEFLCYNDLDQNDTGYTFDEYMQKDLPREWFDIQYVSWNGMIVPIQKPILTMFYKLQKGRGIDQLDTALLKRFISDTEFNQLQEILNDREL